MAKIISDQKPQEPGQEEQSFSQMLEESFGRQVESLDIGAQVDAKVVAINDENVFLDLGTRVEGSVRKNQFMDKEKLTVSEGDSVNVFVVGKKGGFYICSRYMGAPPIEKKGKTQQDTGQSFIQESYELGRPLQGKVVAVNKGGFDVEIKGQKVFCPISQIDLKFCDKPDEHLEKSYTFMVSRYEEDGRNIVVSRREYLQKEKDRQMAEIWSKIELDEVYEGTITNVANYGAFVDIGGVEGLLHVSEISFEKVNDARDVLKPGQTLRVAVIDLDKEARKIGLSVKIMLDDPWDAAVEKLSEGKEFQGKVVRLKQFGAFVELFPGIDGLVHISKLGSEKRIEHPKEVVKVGDIVKVRVLGIDEKTRRISLTMEQEEDDYTKDMQRIREEQDKSNQQSAGGFGGLLDEALKNK